MKPQNSGTKCLCALAQILSGLLLIVRYMSGLAMTKLGMMVGVVAALGVKF